MDAVCKCLFIIIETIVNSMKTRHVSKVIDLFKELVHVYEQQQKNTFAIIY